MSAQLEDLSDSPRKLLPWSSPVTTTDAEAPGCGLAPRAHLCVTILAGREGRGGHTPCRSEGVMGWASLVAQTAKNLPAVCKTWVRSLGWEDPLEEGGHGNPLQYSCLKDSMDRGAWL